MSSPSIPPTFVGLSILHVIKFRLCNCHSWFIRNVHFPWWLGIFGVLFHEVLLLLIKNLGFRDQKITMLEKECNKNLKFTPRRQMGAEDEEKRRIKTHNDVLTMKGFSHQLYQRQYKITCLWSSKSFRSRHKK